MEQHFATLCILLELVSIFCVLFEPSTQLDNFQEEKHWRILTKDNFTAELKKHEFALCIATLPWCGESRSIMREIARKVNGESESLGKLQLFVVYTNTDRLLGKLFLGASTPSLTLFRFGTGYNYNGKLSTPRIMVSIQRGMAHAAYDLPFQHIDSPSELRSFVDSTDKAFVLFEFCGWELQQKQKAMGGEDGNVVEDIGTSDVVPLKNLPSEDETSSDKTLHDLMDGVKDLLIGHSGWPQDDSDESLSHNPFWRTANTPGKDRKGDCSVQGETNVHNTETTNYEPVNIVLPLSQKVEEPILTRTCSLEQSKQFEVVYSNLSRLAANHVLTPERVRFGVVTTEKVALDAGYFVHGLPWVLMSQVKYFDHHPVYFSGEADLDTFISMRLYSGVVELEGKGYRDASSALLNDTPSIFLFIDRASDSSEIRHKCEVALEAFHALSHRYSRPNMKEALKENSQKGSVKLKAQPLQHYLNENSRDYGVMDSGELLTLLSSSNTAVVSFHKDGDGPVVLQFGEGNNQDLAGRHAHALLQILVGSTEEAPVTLIASADDSPNGGASSQNVLSEDLSFDLYSADSSASVAAARNTDPRQPIKTCSKSCECPWERLTSQNGLKEKELEFCEWKKGLELAFIDGPLVDMETRSLGLEGSGFSIPLQNDEPLDTGIPQALSSFRASTEMIRNLLDGNGVQSKKPTNGRSEQVKADLEGIEEEAEVDENILMSFFLIDGEDPLQEKLTMRTESPSVVIVDPKKLAQYVFPIDLSVTLSSLMDFVDLFKSGGLESAVLSGTSQWSCNEGPEPSFVKIDPVPLVTESTFSKLVMGEHVGLSNSEERSNNRNENRANQLLSAWDKDVLVLFTTPWCGFCKRMELAVREVHHSLKKYVHLLSLTHSRHSSGIFGNQKQCGDVPEAEVYGCCGSAETLVMGLPILFQMDCTMNDCSHRLENILEEETYPAVVLFPAKIKNSPVVYDGAPTVHGIFNFIGAHGTASSMFCQRIPGDWVNIGSPRYKQDRPGFCKPDAFSRPSASIKIGSDVERGLSQKSTAFYMDLKSKGLDHTRIPSTGSMLLASKTLSEASPVFENSIVLIIAVSIHDGVYGLIMNKPMGWEDVRGLDIRLEQLLNSAALAYGGPVVEGSRPFLALTRLTSIIGFSAEVLPGVFYGSVASSGGLLQMIETGEVASKDFWFFLGYSSWNWQQLQDELSLNLWQMVEFTDEFVHWPLQWNS